MNNNSDAAMVVPPTPDVPSCALVSSSGAVRDLDVELLHGSFLWIFFASYSWYSMKHTDLLKHTYSSIFREDRTYVPYSIQYVYESFDDSSTHCQYSTFLTFIWKIASLDLRTYVYCSIFRKDRTVASLMVRSIF